MKKMRAFAQLGPKVPLEEINFDHSSYLRDNDVEITVESCSVCHSDVHLVDGDWGPMKRPLIPGHEIIGTITRLGDSAAQFGVNQGMRVGLGWQAGACGRCDACQSEREHLCTLGKERTCVGRVGGFAELVRCDARFCFPLPANLDPKTAAPLLCAGLTVFSPLRRFNIGRSNKVGVVGIGGLGHLAVRFASAMGAQVVAFDPDPAKKELALSLGASDFHDATAESLPENILSHLLVTTHAALDWTKWMRVLQLEGTLCLVGVPTSPLKISADPLLDEQKSITGSVIGSPQTMREMLTFAGHHQIAPIVERMDMTVASANEALSRVREGKARMRIILDRN